MNETTKKTQKHSAVLVLGTPTMGRDNEDDNGFGLATKVCLSAAGAWVLYSARSYYNSQRALAVEQATTVGQLTGKRMIVTGRASSLLDPPAPLYTGQNNDLSVCS